MADRYARLGIERPVLPEMGELVRWEPTEGRVKFGRVAAYQTNLRSEVIGLMVVKIGQAEPMNWPLAETRVVDLTDPKQMVEWMHSE